MLFVMLFSPAAARATPRENFARAGQLLTRTRTRPPRRRALRLPRENFARASQLRLGGQCHVLFLHACPVGGATFTVGSR